MAKLLQGGALYLNVWSDTNGTKTGERLVACSQEISLAQSAQEAIAYCNDEGVAEKSDIFDLRLDRTLTTELLEISPRRSPMRCSAPMPT